MSFLETRKLEIGYPGRTLFDLSDISYTSSSLVCLFGKNGCGKSTLLKTFAGLLDPLSGEVRIGDISLTNASVREKSDMLFFLPAEFPFTGEMSTKEFLGLGCQDVGWFGKIGVNDENRILHYSNIFGVSKLMEEPFKILSDGQKQSVKLVQALLTGRKILLLDEPLSHLDQSSKVEAFHLLKKICQEEKKLILMATHDWPLLLGNAEELLVVPKKGIARLSTPEDLVWKKELSHVFDSKDHVGISPESGLFYSKVESCFKLNIISNDSELEHWLGIALEKMGMNETSGNMLGTISLQGDAILYEGEVFKDFLSFGRKIKSLLV